MSGCCGPCCSKTFVILYNIIFWVSGCAMVGAGVLVLYDIGYTHLYTLFNQHPEKYPSEFLFYGAYAVIGLGGLVLFIGFFGCCGALQESKCMLGTYIFFLILICFVEAVIALGCVYCHFSFPTEAKSKLKQELVAKYNVSAEYGKFTEAIDFVQVNYKCCGVGAPKDYEEIRNSRGNANSNSLGSGFYPSTPSPLYPPTCCILSEKPQLQDPWQNPNPRDMQSCQDQVIMSDRHTQGCWKEMEKYLWLYTLIIAGASGGFAILQIFGVLFSLCLIRNIGEEA